MRRTILIMAACCFAAAGRAETGDLRGALDLARAAAEHGRAARDPLALLVAARLRRDLGLTVRSGAMQEGFDTPVSLVEEARAMAGDDARVGSLADDVLAFADKGRERGPMVDLGRLPGGGREVYAAMRFSGGGRAEVYVEAKGRVAVSVRDAAGAPVCDDDPGGPVAYCWWRQNSEGAVTVEIVNRADAPTPYRLVTN